MQDTPNKGPIRHLEKYILKYDKIHKQCGLGTMKASYIKQNIQTLDAHECKTHNGQSQETTSPTWLLPSTYGTQRCHYNARFEPDLLCVVSHPYNYPPPRNPTPELIIQFIKFTYCNGRFATEALEIKTTKYQPLINNIAIKRMECNPGHSLSYRS